jgi:hypothetical protein
MGCMDAQGTCKEPTWKNREVFVVITVVLVYNK